MDFPSETANWRQVEGEEIQLMLGEGGEREKKKTALKICCYLQDSEID